MSIAPYVLDSATENLFRKMQSPDHCLHTLLTPDRPLSNRPENMILSCPDVHLICIDDLSSFTVCLNLLVCELVFTDVCIPSCKSVCIYVCYVQNKRLLTYLLTYLLNYLLTYLLTRYRAIFN